MLKKEGDFQKRLLATFKVEAQEHVNTISSGLIELEKEAAIVEDSGAVRKKGEEIIETIFREAHSLKGAARAVNMAGIETICQSLESVFAALKRSKVALSPELFDILHKVVDFLSKLLSAAGTGQGAEERLRISELTRDLESVSKGGPPLHEQEESKNEEQETPLETIPEVRQPSNEDADSRTSTEERPALMDTVRISATKLDSVLLQAEELVSAKLAAGQRAADLRETGILLHAWEKEWSRISPHVRTVQRSFDREKKRKGEGKSDLPTGRILDFLEWNAGFFKSLEARFAVQEKSAEENRRLLNGMVDSLLDDMKKALMLPFSSLLEVFPRFVRELSRDQGKDVEMVIEGGDIEVDRRILEEMKDPLIHLVRNCIDHGIEAPSERERKKKPPRGTVTIAIAPKNGSKVEILIADDGTGIDAEKVKSAALKSGVISQEEVRKLNEQEVLALIFQSGVSTSPIITDLSGRGIGLAIVREKVGKLGGVVNVETHQDVGTTFKITLPMTLARFRGVVVRLGENLYVLPTTSVDRVMRVDKEDIKTVENRETISVDGQAVSLVRLGNVLALGTKKVGRSDPDKVPVVILGSAEKRIAFQVDEVLDEEEVLVKSLGRQLSRVRNVASATVLGSGKVVPILNVPDLLKSAVSVPPTRAAATEEVETKKKSILVAEDSITARTLLKNILEVAGYDVTTAVDGLDAFTILKMGNYTMVVSDVDMPRMNGFDLTAKIRAEKKFAELPVVLVTALESREDRERGIEAGANAYIVKSSFDQSNLLEVIRRLV